jgi:hypothetical protein
MLLIIFSYNRAIQLDFLLKSIIKRFKLPDYKIVIIYHTTGAHKEGYQKLKNKYNSFPNMSFLERKKRILNVGNYLKTFTSKRNLKTFLLHSYLHNENSDNFKGLLECLLKNTDSEFVMFNTDDGYFFDNVIVPNKVFDLIRLNPLQTSYRLYVGENLDGFPDYPRKDVNNNIYRWNYYEKKPVNHWTYPFAVDGTIYHANSILNIIEKVPYHNPITLESYVVKFVKEKRLLEVGLSPITSRLICTKLNRVSTSTLNPTINISTDFLNSKFLDGYELELEIPSKITNANIVPDNVFIVKGNQKISVYTLDKYGKDVQDALGPEGTKYQV